MTERPKLPRTVRGKRPQFVPTEGVDEVMSMVLVLAQELTILRERQNLTEKLLAARGIDIATEIEAFEPDDAHLRAREAELQSFYGRLFYTLKQRREELEQKYSEESYQATLDKVASGEI